jgi:hypothetical protein
MGVADLEDDPLRGEDLADLIDAASQVVILLDQQEAVDLDLQRKAPTGMR